MNRYFYFMFVLPGIIILTVYGWSRLPGRMWGRMLLAVVVATNVASIGEVLYHADHEREDWSGVTNYIEQYAETGDSVLLQAAFVQIDFEHYFSSDDVPTYGLEDVDIPADLGLTRVWVI